MTATPARERAAATPVVEFRNAGLGYEGHTVVREVSLAVHAGEFVGLIGPSGAGKTTLLRGMLGIVGVYQGEVLVEGKRVGPRHRPAVGYVPQLNTVDWTFPINVEEAVLLSGAATRLGPFTTAGERRRMQDLLERLGIAEMRKRHIRNLSGGQQQRVFLARALLRNSRLIVLDEPTTGVDIKTRDDVLHLLAELNAEGTTIILSTHEINAVAAHLPRVICLNGKVIADGSPEETFTPEILARTYNAPVSVVHQEGVVVVVETPHEFRAAMQHVHREGASDH